MIKLKKASSHLSFPLMRLISSTQIRSKLSNESKSDVSKFKVSFRGIYKEILSFFEYKLQSDCIRYVFPTLFLPYRKKSSSDKRTSFNLKFFSSKKKPSNSDLFGLLQGKVNCLGLIIIIFSKISVPTICINK